MSITASIDALVRPIYGTCTQTCLVMLDRYRSARAGIFHHPSELEAMLFPDSKKQSEKLDPDMNFYLRGKGSTLSEIAESRKKKSGVEPKTIEQGKLLAKYMHRNEPVTDEEVRGLVRLRMFELAPSEIGMCQRV